MNDDAGSSVFQPIFDWRVILALIALIALAAWQLATSDNFFILLTRELGEPRVVAAVISGVALLAGVVLSALMGLIRDWAKEHSLRKRLAVMLLHEIYGHGGMIAAVGSMANLKSDRGMLLMRSDISRLEPPTPIVFNAVAGEIGIFPHQAAGSIVAFYGAIQTARNLTGLLPAQQPESGSQKTFHEQEAIRTREKVALAWQGAATNAVRAIKSLQPYSPEGRSKEGDDKLQELMDELADVGVNKGYPRYTDVEPK